MKRVVSFVLIALAFFSACTREEPRQKGEPRFPDDQGLVTSVSLKNIELDGERRYELNDETESFSTYNETITPVLSWKNKYVHVGLRGDVVAWVAGIGVVDKSKDPAVVHYTSGLLKRVDDKRNAIFADGTVLKLDEPLGDPPVGERMAAEIEAGRHVVILIRVAPSSSPSP